MFIELTVCIDQINILRIFELSCDTEDWGNNAENSALPSQDYITV